MRRPQVRLQARFYGVDREERYVNRQTSDSTGLKLKIREDNGFDSRENGPQVIASMGMRQVASSSGLKEPRRSSSLDACKTTICSHRRRIGDTVAARDVLRVIWNFLARLQNDKAVGLELFRTVIQSAFQPPYLMS